jgi:hypothetical protein
MPLAATEALGERTSRAIRASTSLSESWASALSSLSWASSRSVVTAFERRALLAALRRVTPSPYTRPVKFRDRESQLSLKLMLGRLFAVPNSAKSCFLTADELSSRLQTAFG